MQRRSLVTFADVILPSRACSCSPFDFCFLVISSCSLEKKKWMASQGKKTCHVVWLFCFCFVFFAVAFFRLRMRNKPLKHNPLSFFLFLRHRPLANRLPVSRLSSLFFLFFFFLCVWPCYRSIREHTTLVIRDGRQLIHCVIWRIGISRRRFFSFFCLVNNWLLKIVLSRLFDSSSFLCGPYWIPDGFLHGKL